MSGRDSRFSLALRAPPADSLISDTYEGAILNCHASKSVSSQTPEEGCGYASITRDSVGFFVLLVIVNQKRAGEDVSHLLKTHYRPDR